MFNRIKTTNSSEINGIKMDETASHAIKLAHRRQWTFISSIVLVLCIGVGIVVYSNVSKDKESKLVKKYLIADVTYQSETEAFVNSLQNQQNLNNMTRPQHQTSAKLFQEFIKENPNTPLSLVAGLRAATEYIENNDYDPAIKILEGMLIKTQRHLLFQVKVRRALASLYAEKGDYQKALTELDFLMKLPDNPILPETKLFAAKVHYMAGEKEKSAALLKELTSGAELSLAGDRSSVSQEAAIWLSYWEL